MNDQPDNLNPPNQPGHAAEGASSGVDPAQKQAANDALAGYEEELLLAYIEQRMTDDQKALIEQQFEAEPRLKHLLDDLLRDRDRLKGLPLEPAPMEVIDHASQALERAMLLSGTGPDLPGVAVVKRPSRRLTISRMVGYGAVAAMLAITAGGIYLLINIASRTHQPMLADSTKTQTTNTQPKSGMPEVLEQMRANSNETRQQNELNAQPDVAQAENKDKLAAAGLQNELAPGENVQRNAVTDQVPTDFMAGVGQGWEKEHNTQQPMQLAQSSTPEVASLNLAVNDRAEAEIALRQWAKASGYTVYPEERQSRESSNEEQGIIQQALADQKAGEPLLVNVKAADVERLLEVIATKGQENPVLIVPAAEDELAIAGRTFDNGQPSRIDDVTSTQQTRFFSAEDAYRQRTDPFSSRHLLLQINLVESLAAKSDATDTTAEVDTQTETMTEEKTADDPAADQPKEDAIDDMLERIVPADAE